MRYLISFLLLFAILENVLSDQSLKKRMLRVALKIKEIQKRKEMQRKLEDESDQPNNAENVIENNSEQTVEEPQIPEDIPYNDTGDGNPESSNPFANDTILPPNKPFSTPKKTKNKNTNIQAIKYYGYDTTPPTTENPFFTITFKVYIYIIGIPIPKVIVYRLRIAHNPRLRSLEEVGDESVRSGCTLLDTSLAGKVFTDGESPNYYCEANTQNDPKDAQVAINTDVDIAYSNPNGSFEYLSFDEIGFNGNSSEEASNLQQSTEEIPQFAVLKNGDILDDGDRYTLRIKGTIQQKRVFEVKDNVTMNFENLYKDGDDNIEPYECTINSTDPFILNCDTSRHAIRTSLRSLHLSSGVMNISVTRRRAEETIKQKLLMIEMEKYNNTETFDYYTKSSNTYRKKSSGLSGGAIAGIVIACVVVLVAASIAAIMLRKPTPPIDNTTVIGLKSADNL